MLPLRNILVPIDFSEHSDLAFRVACTMARDTNATIIALHVMIPPTIVYGEGVVPPVPEDYPAEWQRKLEAIEAPTPNVVVDHELIEGDPAKQILDAARVHHCDLIVMGTHGRTGFGRLILGSVAEKVMRKAPCPVLTVRAQPTPKAAETPAREEVNA